ncbi:MAG: L-serine ammonia-lyase, iron-sulfur-dependent, subunit alpha, partial [Anaerosomatales bacterium]|nr:L-serine ammonia-lyase, iron-sulfur-dependent, subunit alpha [Anaerosomatales bacterium]
QAETGAAAAMAAAAVVELAGGTPAQAGHAAAFALQGLLGLVCDPVGGLVEVPCVARNATAVAVALAAVEMALAGLEFPIPLDEVVSAMGQVGRSLPPSLRETALGGLAATPTARALASKLDNGYRRARDEGE